MRNPRGADRLASGILWVAGLAIFGLLALLLFSIIWRGLPVLNWHFLTARPSAMQAGGGIGPQLFNSFYILFFSLLFSLPVGMGAGIFLAEYARPGRVTDLLRLSTESLASIPSIVLGLFGMIVFVNTLGLGFTIIGGAATLALLNLPVLVRITEETLRAVPETYREGSLALGATQFQTLWRVTIPAALPGLITGVTLVAGRALGETAILIFTAGTSSSRFVPDFNPTAPGETLAVHLWATFANPLVPDAQRIADGTAALLVLVVLFFNLVIGLPGRLLHRRLQGKAR